MSLSKEARQVLINIARTSIEAHAMGEVLPDLTPRHWELEEPRGVFVTLSINKQLRGCIGQFESIQSLAETVQSMAIAASSSDSRFPAVSCAELEFLEIDISILSPLEKIESIDSIKLGTHGILMRQDSRSGCFLPQVATENGWSREQFLGYCAEEKAGIGWEGWREAEFWGSSRQIHQ